MAFLGHRRGRLAWWAWAGLVLAGCDYLTFDVDEDQAAVRVVEPSGSFGSSGFGAVLAAWRFEGEGGLQGRLAVGAGEGGPVAVYPVWRDGTLGRLDRPLFDACAPGEAVECGDASGAAVLGVPRWADGTGELRTGCVLATSPSDGFHVFSCEDSWGVYRPVRTDGGGRAGAAAVALPASARSDLGVALLGAPELGTAGGVILLPGGATEPPQALWATDEPPLDQPGAQLGAALAATEASDGSVVVAIGAPGAERVLVGRLLPSAAGAVFELDGCLGPQEAAPGFGGVVVLGDFDGDGTPELVASAAEEAAGRLPRLWRWSLGAVTGRVGCEPGGPAAPPPDQVVSCDTIEPVDTDVSLVCDGAGFAVAMAAGDLDADDRDELLVGAPGAAVGATREAGMVVVLDGDGGALQPEAARLLYDVAPEEGARLGASVVAVPSAPGGRPRAEAAAGAPGANRAFLFLCSGLDGDRPSREDGTDRCL